LDTLQHSSNKLEDKFNYITQTQDGKILKSSTIYIRNDENKPIGIFSINYDITELTLASNCIESLIGHSGDIQNASTIPQNVTQLLDDLLNESVKKIGKPVQLMSKEDKIKQFNFLMKPALS
jgi:predicted transcriptional regulator YheO